MNNSELFSRDASIDLSRLNEAERRVLRLLAEGHTAKSIATALASTAAAVNERLREARRKTGVGSSRELARLLKAQENRDEQIGVAKERPVSAAVPSSGAERWRPHYGVIAMISLFLVALATATLMSQAAPPAANEVDPMIGQALPKFTDPAELHRRVRAEARDASWAPATEAAIRERVLQIPLVGKGGNPLRVLCATTLCEISGTLMEPESKAEREDQNSQYGRTIKDLQVAPFTDDLGKLGLKSESGLFTGAKGKPDRSVFMLYYSRVKQSAT